MRTNLLLATLSMAATASLAAPCDSGVPLFETRKFAEARTAFEPCAASDSQASLYSGRAWFAEREVDRAIGAFERAVTLDPHSSEAQRWLGNAYAQKASKASVFAQISLAKKIHTAFEKAVALDPRSVEAQLALVDFYLLAPGIMGGSVEKARGQAAEIRRQDPLKGYQAYGHIAEHEKKYAEAVAEYERAARDFPQRKEPDLWLANVAGEQKQNAKAFEILEALRLKFPADATLDFAIGRLGVRTGERLDRAEECFQRYLGHEPGKDDPSLAAAHYQLGVIHQMKGRRDQAIREWREVLALEPGHPAAKEALAGK